MKPLLADDYIGIPAVVWGLWLFAAATPHLIPLMANRVHGSRFRISMGEFFAFLTIAGVLTSLFCVHYSENSTYYEFGSNELKRVPLGIYILTAIMVIGPGAAAICLVSLLLRILVMGIWRTRTKDSIEISNEQRVGSDTGRSVKSE